MKPQNKGDEAYGRKTKTISARATDIATLPSLGFKHDDKLYLLVCEAYEASWRLSHDLHYCSCDGVYRAPKKTDSEKSDTTNTEPDNGDLTASAAASPR